MDLGEKLCKAKSWTFTEILIKNKNCRKKKKANKVKFTLRDLITKTY